MSFQEDLYEFLDVEQGFAITATLHLASGEEYVITGIMSEEYLSVDSGMAGVYGSKPIFECAEEDIKEVEYGDLLNVHNKSYRIIEIKGLLCSDIFLLSYFLSLYHLQSYLATLPYMYQRP